MTIGPGVTGLLGPNGAGKSTLIHLMGGFLAPSSGTVTLDGEPTWRNEQIYRRIGLVPEREAMYDVVTGWQFVLANAKLQRAPRPRGRGARGDRGSGGDGAGAGPRHLDLLEGHEAAGQDGDRTRARPRRVLLLDEPFNGMDPRQRLQLMDLLRSMGDRAAPCCSARTSSRRSSRSRAGSRSWWPGGTRPRGTSARSGG